MNTGKVSAKTAILESRQRRNATDGTNRRRHSVTLSRRSTLINGRLGVVAGKLMVGSLKKSPNSAA